MTLTFRGAETNETVAFDLSTIILFEILAMEHYDNSIDSREPVASINSVGFSGSVSIRFSPSVRPVNDLDMINKGSIIDADGRVLPALEIAIVPGADDGRNINLESF